MKFRVLFERQVTQQAEVVVECDENDGWMVRHKARKSFDPRTADWIQVDEGLPSMAEAAEEITEVE